MTDEQHYAPGELISSYAMLALSMAFVGTSMTANKIVSSHVPIMLSGLIRFGAAVVILIPLVIAIESRIPHLTSRQHLILALQGFFGAFLFNIFLLHGVRMTSASMTGIITAATPAAVAIISFLLGDRLTPRAWLGIVLTIGGVILINSLASPPHADAPHPWIGGGLVLLAVICEALYTIFGRMTARDLPPLGSTAWIVFYCAVMFLPFGVMDAVNEDVGAYPADVWWAFAFLAVFVTVAAIALWMKGLQRVPASTAGAFTGVMPITAVIAGWLVLREDIGWIHLAGMAVIVISILIVARARAVTIPTGSESTRG